MAIEERWQLVHEDVTLYAPEVSRDSTPDEFLDMDERQHTIIKFENVLVGCKMFPDDLARNDWVHQHKRGKRVELYNPDSRVRKAGNIIEVQVGEPPDDNMAAVMIYIERILPPEDVVDWII
ncbi:MAG: hypothetical protein JXR73_20125 [Candidatus Omnitrophica bacterium]|nr:hypothetical protein [Candidatus Omnitrophota bacterium]